MEYTILNVENEKQAVFSNTCFGHFYTMNKWRLAPKNEGLIRKINLQADTAVRWRAKIEGELPTELPQAMIDTQYRVFSAQSLGLLVIY